MKKLIIIILPLIVLFGCVTQKKCDSKFPPVINNIIKIDTLIKHDSIYITERDTTFIIRVGRDTTIYKTDTVTEKAGIINSRLITIEGEYSKTSAQVVNGKLKLQLDELHKDVVVTLKGAIKEKNVYKLLYEAKYKEVEKTNIRTNNSVFATFTIWFFWLAVAAVIAKLLWKYRKLLFKIPL